MQTTPQPSPPPRAACGGPSLTILRSLDAGELRGGELVRVRSHTDACPDCQAVLQDFVADRLALKTALPFAALEARLEKPPARAPWLRWLGVGTGVLAAGLAVVLLAPGQVSQEGPAPAGTQTKGGRTLDFVVKSGSEVRPGQDGDRLRAGDSLEFKYNADGLGYVLIVGVDADGKVFPYVTEGDRSAPAGKGVLLSPNAVILDEDPRAERVFAVFSKEPVGVDELKPAVRDGLSAAQGSIEALTSIPGYPDQATLLIRKAAP